MTLKECREEMKKIWPGNTFSITVDVWTSEKSGDYTTCDIGLHEGMSCIKILVGESLQECYDKVKAFIEQRNKTYNEQELESIDEGI